MTFLAQMPLPPAGSVMVRWDADFDRQIRYSVWDAHQFVSLTRGLNDIEWPDDLTVVHHGSETLVALDDESALHAFLSERIAQRQFPLAWSLDEDRAIEAQASEAAPADGRPGFQRHSCYQVLDPDSGRTILAAIEEADGRYAHKCAHEPVTEIGTRFQLRNAVAWIGASMREAVRPRLAALGVVALIAPACPAISDANDMPSNPRMLIDDPREADAYLTDARVALEAYGERGRRAWATVEAAADAPFAVIDWHSGGIQEDVAWRHAAPIARAGEAMSIVSQGVYAYHKEALRSLAMVQPGADRLAMVVPPVQLAMDLMYQEYLAETTLIAAPDPNVEVIDELARTECHALEVINKAGVSQAGIVTGPCGDIADRFYYRTTNRDDVEAAVEAIDASIPTMNTLAVMGVETTSELDWIVAEAIDDWEPVARLIPDIVAVWNDPNGDRPPSATLPQLADSGFNIQ